jgi:hypothetical protein
MSTDKEKMQHLIDGGRLIYQGVKKHLDSDGKLIAEYGEPIALFLISENEIYHEPKWYDNIPGEGVLCWVSDTYQSEYKIVCLINKYIKEREFKFCSMFSSWTYATPITIEEANKYILEKQK